MNTDSVISDTLDFTNFIKLIHGGASDVGNKVPNLTTMSSSNILSTTSPMVTSTSQRSQSIFDNDLVKLALFGLLFYVIYIYVLQPKQTTVSTKNQSSTTKSTKSSPTKSTKSSPTKSTKSTKSTNSGSTKSSIDQIDSEYESILNKYV